MKELKDGLRELVADENESQVVEWKESWQDKYLEWICVYADALFE